MCHIIGSNRNRVFLTFQDSAFNMIYVGLKRFILKAAITPSKVKLESLFLSFSYNSVLRVNTDFDYVECIPRTSQQNIEYEIYTALMENNLELIRSKHLTKNILRTGYHIASFDNKKNILELRGMLYVRGIEYPPSYFVSTEHSSYYLDDEELFPVHNIILPVAFKESNIIFYDGSILSAEQFRFLTPDEHEKLLDSISNVQAINVDKLKDEYLELYVYIKKIAFNNKNEVENE